MEYSSILYEESDMSITNKNVKMVEILAKETRIIFRFNNHEKQYTNLAFLYHFNVVGDCKVYITWFIDHSYSVTSGR